MQDVNGPGAGRPSKAQFVENVKQYVQDNPVLERFFKDKPDYIKEMAQKIVDLENDPNSTLGSKDLLPKTIKVSMHQQVLYCGQSLNIEESKEKPLTAPLFVQF